MPPQVPHEVLPVCAVDEHEVEVAVRQVGGGAEAPGGQAVVAGDGEHPHAHETALAVLPRAVVR